MASLKMAQDVCKHITSKRIELEIPVAQVLKIIEFASNPEQPGLSSSVCLEVMMQRT